MAFDIAALVIVVTCHKIHTCKVHSGTYQVVGYDSVVLVDAWLLRLLHSSTLLFLHLVVVRMKNLHRTTKSAAVRKTPDTNRE